MGPLRSVWDELEMGLGSVGRIRIVREMALNPNGHFTRYALERATGLKPVDVRRCLKILVDIGWVLEYPYEPKTYRINMGKGTVRAVADLFVKLAGEAIQPADNRV